MTESNPNQNPQRSRLEDEVLEILSRTDRKPPVSARARSFGRKTRVWLTSLRYRLAILDSAWGWFGIAMVIFLLGGALTHGSGLGNRLVQYIGLAAVLIGIIRLFRPSKASGGKKMWRGNVIDMNKRGVELGDKWDDWKRRR